MTRPNPIQSPYPVFRRNWAWLVQNGTNQPDKIELELGLLGRERITVNDKVVTNILSFQFRRDHSIQLPDQRIATLSIRADWSRMGLPVCHLKVEETLLEPVIGMNTIDRPEIAIPKPTSGRIVATVVHLLYLHLGSIALVLAPYFLPNTGKISTIRRLPFLNAFFFIFILILVGDLIVLRKARKNKISLLRQYYENLYSNYSMRSQFSSDRPYRGEIGVMAWALILILALIFVFSVGPAQPEATSQIAKVILGLLGIAAPIGIVDSLFAYWHTRDRNG